jgi:PAS domain S-box-containing protein
MKDNKGKFSDVQNLFLNEPFGEETSQIVLNTILNSTPDIIYVADVESRHIIYINQRIRDILGLEEEEIYSKGFDVFPDLVHPADYMKRMDQMTTLVEKNTDETIEIEARMKGNSGYRWFRIREKILKRTDKGLPEKLIGIWTDIQDSKKEAEEKKKLAKDVQKKNQLLKSLNSELETFNKVITKEFSEVLKNMYTSLEYITVHDSKHLSDTGRGNIRRTQSHAQKLRLMAMDVASYLHLSNYNAQPVEVDMNALLNKVFVQLKKDFAALESSVQLATLPVIYGNSMLLGLLFQNLLENAIKFRKVGEQLVIKIGYSKADELNFHPQALRNTAYNIISFKDNGLGFDQQFAEKIFSIFFKLDEKDKHKGTGMGLAVCKKIMDLHGGFITAESELGTGTTFYCYFPITENESQE